MAKKLVLLIFTFLVGINLQSQIPEISVTADTNNVLIGDQINIILEAKSKEKFLMNWTPLPDTLGTLEIIQKGKIDTISKQNFYALRQNFLVTSFDGGTYPLPSLTFTIFHSDNSIDTLLTEPLYLKFNSVEVDTTKDIKDIKGPLSVPMDWKRYLLYLLILLIITALLVFGYKYWKTRNQKRPDLGYDPSIPPYISALEALKQLESEKLWQSGYVKKYYIRLTDIVRIYIERQFNIMAMEMVTPEIISSLRENNFDQNLINDMSELFSLADFVKFAKHQPLPDENTKCMNFALNFVNVSSTMKTDEHHVSEKKEPDESEETQKNQTKNTLDNIKEVKN